MPFWSSRPRMHVRLSTRHLLISQVLEKAAALDKSRSTGRLSLLHGIPIILKWAFLYTGCCRTIAHISAFRDSIGTGPELHMLTTGGSPALGQYCRALR